MAPVAQLLGGKVQVLAPSWHSVIHSLSGSIFRQLNPPTSQCLLKGLGHVYVSTWAPSLKQCTDVSWPFLHRVQGENLSTSREAQVLLSLLFGIFSLSRTTALKL